MRIKRNVIALAFTICCIMMLFSSCSTGNNLSSYQPTDNASAVPEQERNVNIGTVINKDGDQLLITQYIDKVANSYIDAVSFTVNEKTIIVNSDEQTIAWNDVTIGTEVEIWSTGMIQESYPGRTNASKIIVFKKSSELANDSIGPAAAVQTALQSLTEALQPKVKATKSVTLDEKDEQWIVELVFHDAIDEPIVVHVDAQTGEIVPTPFAENDAFRLYSPAAGTEVKPSFLVEGEARVYEAAFSWQLEDGHNILAEGHEMAEIAGPDWGHFKFEVNFEQASQANLTLILFVHSAEDGSVQNQLVIPLKLAEQYINYKVE